MTARSWPGSPCPSHVLALTTDHFLAIGPKWRAPTAATRPRPFAVSVLFGRSGEARAGPAGAYRSPFRSYLEEVACWEEMAWPGGSATRQQPAGAPPPRGEPRGERDAPPPPPPAPPPRRRSHPSATWERAEFPVRRKCPRRSGGTPGARGAGAAPGWSATWRPRRDRARPPRDRWCRRRAPTLRRTTSPCPGRWGGSRRSRAGRRAPPSSSRAPRRRGATPEAPGRRPDERDRGATGARSRSPTAPLR